MKASFDQEFTLKKITFFLFTSVLFLGCQNMVDKTVRDVKYSAYEIVGVEKRDLFKREVVKVKDSQEETGEAFKDALDRLKEVYDFDGGNLEKEYRSLNSAYESANDRAKDVHERIKKLETIAGDIFAEWKKEIAQMSTASLKEKSAKSLRDTQSKYNDYHSALKKSEAKMGPVLIKLKDQVLFLKHNLNAKAVAGLKSESGKIQGDIEGLIKDMNASVAQGEAFAKSIE